MMAKAYALYCAACKLPMGVRFRPQTEEEDLFCVPCFSMLYHFAVRNECTEACEANYKTHPSYWAKFRRELHARHDRICEPGQKLISEQPQIVLDNDVMTVLG